VVKPGGLNGVAERMKGAERLGGRKIAGGIRKIPHTAEWLNYSRRSILTICQLHGNDYVDRYRDNHSHRNVYHQHGGKYYMGHCDYNRPENNNSLGHRRKYSIRYYHSYCCGECSKSAHRKS
jgi:hypothetical protein